MFGIHMRLPSTLRSGLMHSVRRLFIQVQDTPNPQTLKFLPGQAVLPSAATFEYTSAGAAKQSPLALQLFRIEGVKSVFFAEDFVTITKDADAEWSTMRPHVFSTLSDFITSGKEVISSGQAVSGQAEDTVIHPDDSEVVAMIKELLDSRIRPMVQEDGGDIEYRGYDEDTGVVRLKLKGSCTGCPSSSVTLKSGIQNMLQFYVPEVKDVIEEKGEEDEIIELQLKKLEKDIGVAE
ncbi:lpd-8 [Pristionchus pacificus]|uniref:NFU1 iron-sulfur cluster scaffold homolog, mitochondrial n=1 Tax=Pristionchus pacificus TaxID=54126 RepID=A0A2A6CLX0_PRIPA|nr:lpd-8 [Pristionchus pacificus]|eukprot:PDM79204.1 lpd-8 [Pristionchus pacificus]